MKKILITLAPLAGYTNIAYRTFMKKFGCDIVVSEMISDFALIYQNKETDKMIETSSNEHPVAIQLFGGSLDPMLQGLKLLQSKSDYDYLDLNFGCPVNKVIKNNAGSAWLLPERQEELFELVSTLVKNSLKPVTAKIRLGWNEENINVVSTCKILQAGGVKMITIHGRTRAQMYSGSANYDYIKQAVEAVDIPVIANGDINTLEKAIEVIEYTKADGIALGRGCLGNPFLITQIKTYFETGEKLPLPDIKSQVEYLKEHYEALRQLKGDYAATQEIRGIATHYLKGFIHVRDYKVALSMLKSPEEFSTIMDNIIANPLVVRSD